MHDTKASIRRFLGPDAVELGPFGLLGLDPRDCPREAVEAALQQQMDRVASHSEGDTPEADEVRLALHAAAAQLLDPRVRDHLAARWTAAAERRREEGRETAPAAGTAVAKKPTLPPDSSPAGGYLKRRKTSEDAARLIVAGAVIAVAMIGLVIAAILVFATRPTPAPVVTGPAPVPAQASGTGVAATSDPAAQDAQADTDLAAAAASATPIAQSAQSAAGATVATPRGALVDPRKTLKELRDASALARTDAAATIARFDPLLTQLSEWWAAYDPGVRRACDDAVVEALYALGGSPELQRDLHEMLIAPSLMLEVPADTSHRLRLHADHVWPAAWSIGILTRLSRERDLPTRLTSRTSTALDAALGTSRPTLESTFESGAGLALRRLPLFLLTDAKARNPARESAAGASGSSAAVRRWIEACAALAPDDNALERLLCDGLEQILIAAKEPEEDLGVFEAMGILAERIKWRAGGPARARLLDWFRDARVSESDLRVVTAALAGKSGAEGVDQTMVLSVNPAVDDRSRLRAKYAKAWSIETAGGERASQLWLEAARTLMSAPPPTGQIDPLRDTAAFARLNEAARLLWRGERAGAESLLREASTVQDLGAISAPKGPVQTKLIFHLTGRGADGSWAERYFAAERSIPARLQLLAELEQIGRPVGTVDAGILVQEAVIGSPIQVRYAAARIAGQWADEATIVLSALDELPLAPRTRSTAEMMERIARQTMPPLTDPDWEPAVRRALIERLLGILAGGTPEASLEHFAALIADSYLRASGQEPARGAGAAAEGAKRGSELLWTAVRAEADAVSPVPSAPIPLDQIDRRRIGRRTLASGPVQGFAAEQVSIAETMAYVVAGEKPTAATRIQAAISRMQTARRAAPHVFEQLLVTERAILELWLLRFDQEPGGAI